MRVVHVNAVQPRRPMAPEALLQAWSTLPDIAAAVRRAGANVTVVQAFDRDVELTQDGALYKFVAEPCLSGRIIGFRPDRLARAVRTAAPDVIHFNGLDFGWHIRMLCGLGIPMLVQDHASRPGGRHIRRRWGLRKVAGVAFTDAGQADPFISDGSLPRDIPIFSVPESSTRFTPGDRGAARTASGLYGDPAILWVGRLDANKDPLTILDAVESALRSLPSLQLWCCYHEQPLLAQVRARLSASPLLAERVHLLGARPHPDIEILCRAADFFMLGSRNEGSGYALIEAMACGATPVVSDIPSFRRLTGNGSIGALAPIGDAGAFSRALVDLAARPKAELRQQTIAHFQHSLSFDRVGSTLVGIYETLAARAG